MLGHDRMSCSYYRWVINVTQDSGYAQVLMVNVKKKKKKARCQDDSYMAIITKQAWGEKKPINKKREFPGSPVVRTTGGMSLIPGWGTKILQDSQCIQKKKKNPRKKHAVL